MAGKKKVTDDKIARVMQAIELIETDQANISDALKAVGISSRTLQNVIDERADIRELYARARDCRVQIKADKIIKAVSGPPPIGPDGRVDSGAVAHLKLQVDTLKWELAKIAPKIYGDRSQVELTGADGGAVQVQQVTIDASSLSTDALEQILQAQRAAK